MMMDNNLYRFIDGLANDVSRKSHLESKEIYFIMVTQAITLDYLLFDNVLPEIAPRGWHVARQQMRYIRDELKISHTEDTTEEA